MINATPKTKEEQAYIELKALILEGKLPTQKFLSQRMLAATVNTNISTIRTALRLLENDNLIENVPQWGVRIPLETEEVLRDRYFLRELLEVGAVKLIIRKRKSENLDISSIIEKASLCDKVAREEPKDISKFSKVHFDFHLELAQKSGSPLLLQSLEKIHFRSLIQSHAKRGWATGSHINHQLLVDVILAGDEKIAIEEMTKHIKGGLESELNTLAQS
jgi:DNA-binding GntR family transcriptional regulator